MKKIPRTGGFTLVELVLAITITVIAGGLVLSIFVRNGQIFHAEQNKVSQGLSLTDSLKKINDLVKLASAVAGSYNDGINTYTSNLTTLVLALPAINGSGNNVPSTLDYVVIKPDQTNGHILRLKTYPATGSTRISQNIVLSSNLSKVNFFYYDNTGVIVTPANAKRINVTLNTLEQSALFTQPSSASSDINLRND